MGRVFNFAMIKEKLGHALKQISLGLIMVTTMVIVPCIACDCNNGLLESAQATAGGDRSTTASLLRFSQLETGFNSCTYRPNGQPQNNGSQSWNYGAGTNRNSAFGPMQFQEDTWFGTLRGQKSYILQLTQQAMRQTTNAESRSQYQQFYTYVQNNGAGRNWRYFGGQNGPSMIMARALMRANGLGTGGTIDQMVGHIRSINPNVDAVAVSAYISHNLGPGAAQAFLRAMRAGQWDVPVTGIAGINDSHVRANPSNWCRNRRSGSACQPLTLREAIARISNGGVSGQCVQQAFARAGIPTNTVELPAYAAVTSDNPFVPAVAAVPEDSMRILSSATTAGSEANGNCISNGTSRYCDESLTDGAPPPDAQRINPDNPTPPGTTTPAPGNTSPGASPGSPGAPGTPGAPATPGGTPTAGLTACTPSQPLGANCCVLGDSLAVGTGASIGSTCRTKGRVGAGLDEILREHLLANCSTVVISAGSNNFGASTSAIRTKLTAIRQRLATNGAQKIVWILPSSRNNISAVARPIVANIAAASGDQTVYFDDGRVTPDGLHPSPSYSNLASRARTAACSGR